VKCRPELWMNSSAAICALTLAILSAVVLRTLPRQCANAFTFEEGLKFDLQTLATRNGGEHIRDPDVFRGGLGGNAEGPLRRSNARRRRQREGDRELDYECAQIIRGIWSPSFKHMRRDHAFGVSLSCMIAALEPSSDPVSNGSRGAVSILSGPAGIPDATLAVAPRDSK